jgi:hypothetical protein
MEPWCLVHGQALGELQLGGNYVHTLYWEGFQQFICSELSRELKKEQMFS